MKKLFPLSGILALIFSACSSVDSNLNIFAEIEEGPVAPAFDCTTNCTVNVFNDAAKQNLILEASFGTPRSCDEFENLLKQSWEVAQFNLGDATICSQLGDSNPTEMVCTVEGDDNILATTYLAVGTFPFVPQGCGHTNLDFTLLLENLLDFSEADLAAFTCDTLDIAYDANECSPVELGNDVCEKLNALTTSGASDCFL